MTKLEANLFEFPEHGFSDTVVQRVGRNVFIVLQRMIIDPVDFWIIYLIRLKILKSHVINNNTKTKLNYQPKSDQHRPAYMLTVIT